MATKTEIQDQGDSLAQDREALKLRMAEHVGKVDKEYPEANLLAKGDWWMPSIDFGFDVKVRSPRTSFSFLELVGKLTLIFFIAGSSPCRHPREVKRLLSKNDRPEVCTRGS